MTGNQQAASSPSDDIAAAHINYGAQADANVNSMVLALTTHALQPHSVPTVEQSSSRKRGRPPKPVQTTVLEHAKRSARQPLSLMPSSSSTPSENDTSNVRAVRARPWKFAFADLHMPSLPCPATNPRESVEYVLMTFDALRRRLQQLEGAEQAGNKQVHFAAKEAMTAAGLHLGDHSKRIGKVPGVEVGDMFYLRNEMCLVGLHSKGFEGIDYMPATFGAEEDSVATCVVSSGVYDNEDSDPNVLIYTGQGKPDNGDQKLERGNFALCRSKFRGVQIRVIRSEPDSVVARRPGKNKIYIYDGLYSIGDTWIEYDKSSFIVFKYKLVRETGQPDGIAVWKKTQKWREVRESRDHLIMPGISAGAEKSRVCVVNEVDDEAAPTNFTYTTKLDYKNHVSSSSKVEGCKCTGVCLPDDKSCYCGLLNAGDLPYTSSGILVSRKQVLYECNDSCVCPPGCRNRQVQRGSYLQFEVFKTADRGWGLRSWDPIRAGTFICEYAGEVIDRDGMDGADDYIFEATRSGHGLRWNYVPELLSEPSLCDLNDTYVKLPLIISARRTGNVARFMNHSCEPNIFWQPVMYGSHADTDYPHIAFFAIKHIPPMTEFTFDYGQSKGDTQPGGNYGCRTPKNCLCQSPKCRGTFG